MSVTHRRLTWAALVAILLASWAHGEETFRLTSSAIAPNSTIGATYVFDGFGCQGRNLSPPLKWSGAPAGTQSYAITVYDPDAPTGSGWWHWVVYDIPVSVTELGQGASSNLPSGALQARTDFGTASYGGPCPPTGDKAHRYIFTVYALKIGKLGVSPQASPAMIGFALKANKLAEASFTGYYGR